MPSTASDGAHPATIAGCLDENAADDLVHGRLAGDRRAAAAAHLDGCAGCRELVSALARAATRPSGDPLSLDPAELARHGLLATEADGGSRLADGAMVGRYVVLEPIGVGGMGVVHAAWDPRLRRRIALKLVRLDALAGASPTPEAPASAALARARLVREAQAMARLSHPNVVAIHDAGEAGQDVFLAMELVDGSTLAQWLAERPRHWREIRRMFAAAARGLAAAHAAGLVHRDFKPDNVLVAGDGRVAVTDFGLARADGPTVDPADGGPTSAEGTAADAGDGRGPDARLTRTGATVGTPAYMAPEQRAGAPADARTDQYSFCAALHEAVTGNRPPGLPPRTRPLAPARGRVPRRVRRLIARGLSGDPARRHASMEGLVCELEPEPRPRSARIAIAAAALTVGLAAGASLWIATPGSATRAEPPSCRGAERELAGVWDATRKTAVERALVDRAAPHARGTWQAVERSIDRWAQSWVAMRTDACEDNAVRGEQPASVLALRVGCLERRRQELDRATAVLADPDAPLDGAPKVAAALSPVTACGDVAALSAAVPPPADAAVAARVAGLRGRLAEVKSRTDGGQLLAALELVGPLVAEARATGYPPLIAEASYRLGGAEFLAGRTAEAEAHLYDALWEAETGRDDEMVARAWSTLTVLVGYADGRAAEGDRLARHARAATARLATHSLRLADEIRAKLVANESALAFGRGDIARAVDLGNQAIESSERSFGPESPELARALTNQASNLQSLGRLEEALATYRRADRILVVTLGEDHPNRLDLESNMAIALERLGRLEEADGLLERVLERAEALGDPSRQRAMHALERLADVRLAQGRASDALPLLDRALRLRAELAIDRPVERVRALTLRGDILHALGRGDARAAYRDALSLGERALGPANPTLVYPLRGLGESLAAAGKIRAGIRTLERALAIARAEGGDALIAARIQHSLALALWRAGRRASALRSARRARASLASLDGTDGDLAALDRWLADRR